MKTRGVVLVGCICLLLLVHGVENSVAQPGTDCLIKGIIGSNGQKMYLIPGHYLYDKVTPDLNKGERWFCEADGAERAGFVCVPDPTNPKLRPQEVTPTPVPTATPEPQSIDIPEPAETATTETSQATDSSPPESEPTELLTPEATAPSTPEPPTPTPVSVETKEPAVSIAPDNETISGKPFVPPGSSGTFIDLLGPLFEQAPPEVRTLVVLLFAWLWLFFGIIGFFILITVVLRWKIFVKAGEPGWGALIPIYSEVLMLKVAGLSWWWILFGLFPVLNIAYAIVWIFIRPFKMAGNFGQGFLYGLGLFLPIISIFFSIHLAFSDVEYVGL